MAASIEQYAAAQRRVARQAQVAFARWLTAHPNTTRLEAGEAAKTIIHTFAPVAELIADTWYDDVMGEDDGRAPNHDPS